MRRQVLNSYVHFCRESKIWYKYCTIEYVSNRERELHMAHLERDRVVRRQYIFVACLALYLITGIFSHSIHFAYAQDPAETISVSGVKFWVDQNGNLLPEGAHPDSAKLSLYANNEKIDEKTVSAADSWNWEFKDLPKFDENGNEISYVVREDSLGDYKSDMKIALVNTYTPSKEIKVEKKWSDADAPAGARPESVTVHLYADGVLVKSMVLDNGNDWTGTFTELPVMDAASEEKVEYTVKEEPVTDYIAVVDVNPEQGYIITNNYKPITPTLMGVRRFTSARPTTNLGTEEFPAGEENSESSEGPGTGESLSPEENTPFGGNENDTPQTGRERENSGEDTNQRSENDTPQSGRENENSGEQTNQRSENDTPQSGRENGNSGGETNRIPSRERENAPTENINFVRIPESFKEIAELPGTGLTGSLPFHAKLNYEPLMMELEIPSLNVHSEIVKVPSVGGNFPVEGLGMDAGLLEGTALPGEGVSILAAHNTLSREEYGPFALIAALEEGERIFVRDTDGSMMIFEVCSNEKIDASDVSGLFAAASEYEPSVTLLTCEDELLTGGYASRRVVSARKIN